MKKYTSLLFSLILATVLPAMAFAKPQTTDKPPEWSYTATVNLKGEVVPAVAWDIRKLTNVFGSGKSLSLKGFAGVSARSERPTFAGAAVYEYKLSNELKIEVGPGITYSNNRIAGTILLIFGFRP